MSSSTTTEPGREHSAGETPTASPEVLAEIAEPPAGSYRARHPLAEMLSIAAPTVAAMTSYTLMQFVDKVIVSKIGPEPIYVAAAGNGGMAAFVPIAFAMGMMHVVNTYVAQNYGAGRPDRGPAYAWNAVWMCAALALLLVPYGFALPRIFAHLGHEPAMIPLETGYGQILVFGAFLTLATRAVSQFFYGVHHPVVVLAASLIANGFNFVMTYGLVLGKWGLPAMGVPGSAIATVMAAGIELTIPLAVFLSPRYDRLYRTRSAWRPSWGHVRDILRIGWPGGVMFANEMVCWAIFMVLLVSKFGTLHVTAGWATHQWMTLSFMPTVGISIAVTALVGKYIGMGRPDLAERRAWLGTFVSMAYMGACGVCFILFGRTLIHQFVNHDTDAAETEAILAIGSRMLMAVAAFQLFDAVAMCLSGALRGAGDTVVPGVVTIVLSWVVIVGGGYAMVELFPGLESLGPYIAASAYIIVLSLFLLGRFLSGAWKRLELLKHAQGSRE